MNDQTLPDLPGVTRDEYGFFTDPGQWTRRRAEQYAAALGIGALTPAHWAVLEHVREHWLTHGAIQPAKLVCHSVGLEDDCVWRLFGGPLEMWKVAGLPYPGLEAYTYMENEEPAAA